MKRLPIFFTTIVLSLLVFNSARSESEAAAHEKAVTLHTSEIKILADKLNSCTKYSTTFKHPFTGEMLGKEILGIVDGKCVYVEQMPNGGKMECKYTQSERKAVAQFYKDVASAKTVTTHSSIKFSSSSDTTSDTTSETTLDGKKVESPAQGFMKKDCNFSFKD